MKISFGTISVTQKSKDLIKEILDTNRLSNGKYVRLFEEKFAELIGAKEAVALSSGADADALALAVLYDFGAKRGDEVIVPALSFVATGNAVLQAGFKPVFVDIDRKTLNIDPHKIKGVLTEKTRAIMPVHLMGKPADMDAINTIAKQHNLYVIEDAAEAHGAVYKNKNAGILGDMGAFSLYIAHIITTIEGGIIVTDRSDFAEILRSLRSHGRACKCKVCVLNTSSEYCPLRFGEDKRDIRFVFERIGYSTKMNELEAAVGIGNLDIYNDIIDKRRENLRLLMEMFSEFSLCLATIREENYEKIGPHAFPVIIQEQASFTREQFIEYLGKEGIDSRNLFLSMPTQCKGYEFLGYKAGDFPNAEYIGDNGLHIGIHQDLGEEDINYVVEKIRGFLKANQN
ncbi:MAG: DegT/DnrJ/EryC1/StrS family aminotransferase [Candidatus Omnitrophota bacterium]